MRAASYPTSAAPSASRRPPPALRATPVMSGSFGIFGTHSILDHLGLDSRGPPLARAQAPPDALDPAPICDGVDPAFPD